MFLYLAQAVAQQNGNSQSVIGLIGTVGTAALASGGAITIAIGKMFDTKRIEQIVQLRGKIENLEWRLKHREEELIKKDEELIKREEELARREAEIKELERQLDVLREQSNSSMNTQLIDLREKYKKLYNEKRKAEIIIQHLKGEKTS